jgi:hypothetical protein
MRQNFVLDQLSANSGGLQAAEEEDENRLIATVLNEIK